MKSKHAIELSATFLIIILLSVFALIFGISFLARTWTTSKQLKNSVSTDYRVQLNNALASATKGVVTPTTLFVDKQKSFYVGIKNLYKKTMRFNLSVTLVDSQANLNEVAMVPTSLVTLKPFETHIFTVFAKNSRNVRYPVILVVDVKVNNNGWVDYYTNAVKFYK